MSKDPFSDEGFVERFINRRTEHDSVNSCIDEPAILNHISAIMPKFVLELGCANGILTNSISRFCNHVVAVDKSEFLIEIARNNNESANIDFLCDDFKDIDESFQFDLVASGMTMHLIEDFKSLSEKVFNLLMQDGYFIFSQRHPIRTSFPSGEGSVEGYHSWSVMNYFDNGVRHYKWLDRNVKCYHRSFSEITKILIETGFEILEISEPTPKSEKITDRIRENNSIPAVIMFLCKKTSR